MKKFVLAPAALAVFLAGCAGGYTGGGGAEYARPASAAPSGAQAMGMAPAHMKGGMLVNSKDLTLYTFDKDVAGSGKSACVDKCATAWPAHLAGPNDKPMGDYTIIVRDDGKRQWAYRGKPLYTWPEDQEPGDKYGDNYLKVWHIVTQ